MTKKHTLNLVLNEIQQVNDPTILKCTFIVLDYEKSGNNAIVEKDVALEGGKTLINKPIVAKYNEADEANSPTDNFGGHEQYLGEDRYGELTVKSDTVPIGVFTTEGYNLSVVIDGVSREVMAADAVLWKSRFPDACDLLQEWFDSGIKINTSCEYLYSNFSFIDGIEYHNSPIYFEGHAILASEDRGDIKEVLPAYESATLLSFNEINKFNRLVAQAIDQKDDKEDENMPELFKKVCELSHGDIRSLLYSKLDASLAENEYSWISDVYETYFVANIYSFSEENEFDKYFKFNYSKNGEEVEVDLESKSEVKVKRDWVEVTEVQQMQNSLEEKETKLNEIQTQLNSATEKVTALTSEKDGLLTKYNDAATKLTQLNSQVEELSPYKDQVENEKFEKALNEKKEFYAAKFKALNASEKFGEDAIQELVKKAVNEDEEGNNAILQLNTMLVDMVVLKQEKEEETPVVREVASKRENLIPTSNDFESRFSL
ncbi:hypothetical protein ANABIO32_00120 [Rossellomorea marisflavi]|uniref:hypothetical protein n=1 Tax=Rossellomorea marisflavi TaxID=189381 RepID=UPI0025CA54E2|nr:hypothetical protein [Rossellomorea marisflavi]GLI82326.1 hypothetical protein ANABIO32_00120 [Rossellomorea marisflavi]